MIIALTGRKKSGKDTAANSLVNVGFIKYSFAKPIKDLCMSLFGWTWEQCDSEALKETIDPKWGFSPRQVMQWLGSDVFQIAISEKFPEFAKLIGRRFWVNKFIEHYNCIGGVYLDHVISDLRFQHEIDAIKALEKQVYIVRINRPGIEHKDSHMSETSIDSIKEDYLVSNDKTIYNLRDRIIYLAGDLKNGIPIWSK